MKALFLHDHKIYKDGKNIYSRGGLSRKVIARYIVSYHDLTLATRELVDGDIDSLSFLSSGDVTFCSIKNLATPNVFNYIDAYKKLKPLIAQQDTLIVRLPSFVGVFGLMIAKDKNIIIEVVGCPWDSLWNYGSLAGKILAPIQWFLTRHFVKKSNNVIYVTSEFLQKRYPTNAKNTVGCSDVELVPDPSMMKIRKQRIDNLGSHKIKIGMIGNLEANYKGFDTALEAMSLLNKKYAGKYKLEIVGGGDPSSINAIIDEYQLEGCVEIIGTLEHPHGVNAWLDQIDIFIQPSRQEGLPRALIEALSRGCACVGTDVGGIPELLDNENIIKKNDFRALYKLIVKLSSPKELLKEAEYSLGKAKEFDRDDLEQKRKTFYLNAEDLDELKK